MKSTAGHLPRHPRHGAPSQVHTYRDPQGIAYAHVYRFDRADGAKTFALYDPANDNWQAPKARLPYHADRIARHPEKTVVLVEGEKAADALTRLGFVATTAMGGSNAAGRTDWAMLASRNVVLWPDHDTAGDRFADTVIRYVTGMGARVRRLVLNVTTVNEALCNVTRAPESLRYVTNPEIPAEAAWIQAYQTIPAKWDAADAVADGWTVAQIVALLDRAGPVEPTPPAHTGGSPDHPGNTENPEFSAPAQSTNLDQSDWPDPDWSVLAPEIPVPAFPLDTFAPSLAGWCRDAAAASSAPEDYVAGTLLATAASLIGNSRKAHAFGTFTEPAILWLALVGEPSAGKSPAMRPLLKHLKAMEGAYAETLKTAMRDHEALKQEAVLRKAAWEQDVKERVKAGQAAPPLPADAAEPAPPRPSG